MDRPFCEGAAVRFEEDDLKNLAKVMVAEAEEEETSENDVDPEENQGIRAGHTY